MTSLAKKGTFRWLAGSPAPGRAGRGLDRAYGRLLKGTKRGTSHLRFHLRSLLSLAVLFACAACLVCHAMASFGRHLTRSMTRLLAMPPTQMSEARYEHDSGMVACRASKLRSSWLSGSAEGHIGFAVGVICCKWPPTKPHRQSHDLRSEMQRLLSHGALRLRDQ